jgi:hypothetical protein
MAEFRNFLLFVFWMGCFQWCQAQEVKINPLGEKIVVFNDGTWTKLPEKKASAENVHARGVLSIEEKSALDAQRVATNAKEDSREAFVKLQEARQNRLNLENALKNPSLATKVMKAQYQISIQKEKQAEKNWKKANKDYKELAKMTEMGFKKREKAYEKWLEQKEDERRESSLHKDRYTQKIERDIVKNEYDDVYRYQSEDDVYLNPPSKPCNVLFEGVDEFSGHNRKDLAPELFFNYTPEPLRKLYQDEAFMVCEGSMSLSQGYYYLNLKITLNARKADKNYGFLEKGSLLTIKLLNGEIIRLMNNHSDKGVALKNKEGIVYKSQYGIDPNAIKELKKSEVDKVRLFWSTGYEDYEIYELDFFLHQLKCLEN